MSDKSDSARKQVHESLGLGESSTKSQQRFAKNQMTKNGAHLSSMPKLRDDNEMKITASLNLDKPLMNIRQIENQRSSIIFDKSLIKNSRPATQ
jgi:hypothetical protein